MKDSVEMGVVFDGDVTNKDSLPRYEVCIAVYTVARRDLVVRNTTITRGITLE